jgi:hypothetical protein
MPNLVNLCHAVFPEDLLWTSIKLSIFQIFFDQPLNTKKVPHNIAEFLQKIWKFLVS